MENVSISLPIKGIFCKVCSGRSSEGLICSKTEICHVFGYIVN